MKKTYIHDNRLEEYLVNLLRERASKEFNAEDFSFKALMKEVQKNYDVDEHRLEQILKELENKDLVIIKSRSYSVYIPKGYEKKFKGLITTIDPSIYFSVSLIIGYLILIESFLYFRLEMIIRFPNNFIDLLFIGFAIPFVLGVIIVILLKEFWNILYKNIKLLREMVEYFGGTKIWGYSLFLSFIFLIIYVIFSTIMNYEVNPYYATAIFTSVFIAILLYGSRKKSGHNNLVQIY